MDAGRGWGGWGGLPGVCSAAAIPSETPTLLLDSRQTEETEEERGNRSGEPPVCAV